MKVSTEDREIKTEQSLVCWNWRQNKRDLQTEYKVTRTDIH